jgi:hypothetical protein
MSNFLNTLWPEKYNRQSIARLMRPYAIAISDMVQGFLFQLPDTAPVTGDYTATIGDSFIPVNATSAAITITLPAAGLVKGKRYTVKKTDSSANAVTISSTDTIDDGASAVIYTQYVSLCFMSDGTEFWIV